MLPFENCEEDDEQVGETRGNRSRSTSENVSCISKITSNKMRKHSNSLPAKPVSRKAESKKNKHKRENSTSLIEKIFKNDDKLKSDNRTQTDEPKNVGEILTSTSTESDPITEPELPASESAKIGLEPESTNPTSNKSESIKPESPSSSNNISSNPATIFFSKFTNFSSPILQFSKEAVQQFNQQLQENVTQISRIIAQTMNPETLIYEPSANNKPVISTPPNTIINHTGENFAHSCMQGRRPTMEDSFSRYKFGNYCCYAVFDGHGGAQVSAILGEHLFSKFEEKIHELENQIEKSIEENSEVNPSAQPSPIPDSLIKKIIKQLFFEMDEHLYHTYLETQELAQGSTCTAVIIDEVQKKMFVTNLGDSRAIVMKNGKNAFQTMDHKPSVVPEFERIKAAGGCVINNRVQGQLAVSRAFGDFNLKAKKVDTRMFPFNPNMLPLVSVEPDVTVVKFGDCEEKVDSNGVIPNFVILACDGLFDVCSSFKACQLVAMKRKEIIDGKSSGNDGFDNSGSENADLEKADLEKADLEKTGLEKDDLEKADSKNSTPEVPLEIITSYLVQHAYDSKSYDNISVMIIRL